MSRVLLLIILLVCLVFCATTNKLANEAIRCAIVGQDESTVYSRLGLPARTIAATDGGKILIYKYYSRGMYKAPAEIKSRSFRVDRFGNRSGLNLGDVVGTLTYDSGNAIYERYTTYLKAYINSQGNCVQFEQDLTKDQLRLLQEQFKCYVHVKQ